MTPLAPPISALQKSETILLNTGNKVIATSSFVAPTITGSVIECFPNNILFHLRNLLQRTYRCLHFTCVEVEEPESEGPSGWLQSAFSSLKTHVYPSTAYLSSTALKSPSSTN